MTDAGPAPILNVACVPRSATGQAGISRLRNSFSVVSPLTTTRLDSAQGGTFSHVPPATDPDSLASEGPGRFVFARCDVAEITRRPIEQMAVRMMLSGQHAGDVAEPRPRSDVCVGAAFTECAA